jgi:hypothetical protein
MSKKQANETCSESGAGDARVRLADDLGYLLARHWVDSPRPRDIAGAAAVMGRGTAPEALPDPRRVSSRNSAE